MYLFEGVLFIKKNKQPSYSSLHSTCTIKTMWLLSPKSSDYSIKYICLDAVKPNHICMTVVFSQEKMSSGAIQLSQVISTLNHNALQLVGRQWRLVSAHPPGQFDQDDLNYLFRP